MTQELCLINLPLWRHLHHHWSQMHKTYNTISCPGLNLLPALFIHYISHSSCCTCLFLSIALRVPAQCFSLYTGSRSLAHFLSIAISFLLFENAPGIDFLFIISLNPVSLNICVQFYSVAILRSPKWAFSSRFPNENFLGISSTWHVL